MSLFDFFRRKRESDRNATNGAGSTTETDTATRVCFVLCRNADSGVLGQASRVVSEVFGEGHAADIGDKGVVTVSRGDKAVGFLAHIPAPVPGGEAEESADGNVLWPNGKDEAAEHRSHVIVTNITAGELSNVESALGVSRLALVALQLFDGLGVYWGDASVSNSRAVFESFCRNMSNDHLPAPMWLRLQFHHTPENEVGLYTFGLDRFGLMDIEVERCGMTIKELFEFVSDIAVYLIKSGPIIDDGDTVGGSDEARIVVRHRPSMIDSDRRVYKLEFET